MAGGSRIVALLFQRPISTLDRSGIVVGDLNHHIAGTLLDGRYPALQSGRFRYLLRPIFIVGERNHITLALAPPFPLSI